MIVEFPTYLAVTKKFNDDGTCITCNNAGTMIPAIGYVCDFCPEPSTRDLIKEHYEYEPNRLTKMYGEFAKAVHKKMMNGFFKKGRTGWDDPNWTEEEIIECMKEHIEKGDPLDMAIYAAFLWHRRGSGNT